MTAKITLLQQDITQLQVDCIVNAANNSLLGGGGVDGAIHHAAGPELKAYCQTLGGCETGQAKLTPGFNLAAKYIIHTVGPVWQGGQHQEAQLLASCYRQSLALAEQHSIRSIAFPAISCGVFGYPIDQACQIAMQEVANFAAHGKSIRKMIFCAFDDIVYQSLLSHLDDVKSH